MWSKPKQIPLSGPVKQIAVYDSGETDKPVLFFLHGLSLQATIWKYAISQLSGKFRCIAVDLPGHGNSRDQRGNFTMNFYAQTIRACIEAMKLTDITLVGHSMGGQISVILSLQIPAIVQRLVLVCAAGIEKFTAEEGEKIIQGAEFIYRAPLDQPHLTAMYHPHLGKHAERLAELMENHLRLQLENFSAFSETTIASIKGMLAEPVNHFLPHIHQPVLVLFGENDRLIPNKWVHPQMNIRDITNEAKNRLHQAAVKILPDCGHYLPMENGGGLAEEIEAFCKN